MAERILNVPQFLTAPSPKELVRSMLINNIKRGAQHKYFGIQKDGKNWVAWFYADADIDVKQELKLGSA
jgi:hypothetical protein